MTWTYVKLAWRNLLRNKRRSFIAGTAIGIGLACLIFVDALWIGMEDNMIHSATASFMGEGQIHKEGFRNSQTVEETIIDSDQVLAEISSEPEVEHFTPRVFSFAMISSAANLSAVSMIGIDPRTERNLSHVDDVLQSGTYFEEDNQRDVLIGSKLAELLEVDLGDRLVLTVAQAGTGDLSQEMFRVSGIYHFNISEMDRGMAFVRIDKAQEMLAIGNDIHEIAITFKSREYGQDPSIPFWGSYSRSGNEALPWTELMPQLKAALDLSDFSILIIGLILFGIVALGIINTLFMSLYERMFEFGVLRAVGTRPFNIARLIVFEAGALAIVSIVLGSVMGLILTYITSRTGIDYTGIEFAGVTFRQLLYPVLQVDQFVIFPIAVLILTMLVGVYPAVYAARLTPARALRRSL
jgi:ABC-type lipoprotein release transport system permease subunit